MWVQIQTLVLFYTTSHPSQWAAVCSQLMRTSIMETIVLQLTRSSLAPCSPLWLHEPAHCWWSPSPHLWSPPLGRRQAHSSSTLSGTKTHTEKNRHTRKVQAQLREKASSSKKCFTKEIWTLKSRDRSTAWNIFPFKQHWVSKTFTHNSLHIVQLTRGL